MAKVNVKRSSSLTKTGKPKLRSYSLKQLHDKLSSANRPRDKDKIQRFINNLQSK